MSINQTALKKEITVRTTKSSGAGGQHVNKVETKVELLFDVANSKILEEFEKNLIEKRLKKRINKEGLFIISCQSERSQLLNKKAAFNLFFELLEKALIPPKVRKKVLPLVTDSEKRLKQKRQHSEKKMTRQKVILPNEPDL